MGGPMYFFLLMCACWREAWNANGGNTWNGKRVRKIVHHDPGACLDNVAEYAVAFSALIF